MTERRFILITTLFLLLSLPTIACAWCWIRDTGPVQSGCSGSLVKQDCCDGNLRKWPSSQMDYEISNTTESSLATAMQEGIALWNNIDMCTFTFQYIGPTSITDVTKDGHNIIGIDPDFDGDASILAYSSTWSGGFGESYRAVEADIVFNGKDYTWGDGTGGTFNTKAVVAHEAGHNAGLSHPGAQCQDPGSSGCGANVEKATMYYNYSAGQPTDKATLELDDVAGLIRGYPKSTFSVKVLNHLGEPVSGVTVALLDAAAPLDGTSIAEGGHVYGDVTNPSVLMGDRSPSASYISQTPFTLTNTSGLTNVIHPTHRNIRIRATISGVSKTESHTVADGTSTLTVTLPDTGADLSTPLITITSHTEGQQVSTDTITLSGTATDNGRGNSGISKVLVNGNATFGGAATGSQIASWYAVVPLHVGSNTLTVTASDNAASENTAIKTISISHDSTPPSVTQVSPGNGWTGLPVNTTVSARFNEAMDPSTLTTATFTCSQGVAGTVTYDNASHTVTFAPASPLAPQATYTFTLTTGIRDASGTPMAVPVSWSFTTQGTISSTSSSSSSDGGGGGCFIDSLSR